MGLGKSAQAIRAADRIGAERILVVCPAVARLNWAREFKLFAETPRHVFPVLDGRDVPSIYSEVLIYSYDLLVDHFELGILVDFKFDLFIIDEAHFLKSPIARRTKSLLAKYSISRCARRIWALTGTPMPNNVSELWVLLTTFGRTKLSFDAFVTSYCDVIVSSYGRRIVGTKRSMATEIRQLLQPVMLRRMKADVLPELPPVTMEDLLVQRGVVKLSPQMQAQIIQEIASLELSLAKFSNQQQMGILEGVAQSVSTLRRYLGLQKVAPALEIINGELEAGAYDKVVVFASHTEVVAGLKAGLTKWNPVSITGSTPNDARENAINAFQNDATCRVFIGNMIAAGTAITLTAASVLIFVEQDWTPAVNDQARDRVHRIGQTKKVFARNLIVANSIDEKISAILRRKNFDIDLILR